VPCLSLRKCEPSRWRCSHEDPDRQWSLHVGDAVDVGDRADTILARESAARRVNAAYAIEAAKDESGVRPGHIKERIRALGPTVRPDLTLKPADPAAGQWVI
jgi:hypothetical protein